MAGVYEHGRAQHAIAHVAAGATAVGEFVKNDERRAFKPQDVLFVEAHATHCFEKFSGDFSTWVIFWGADGGETTS